MEKTFAIIKPDAVARHMAGDIIKRIEASGLRIVGLRLTQLSRAEAESFYAVHKERPFYKSLCDYMTSGPVIVAVLVGATDPAKAAPGTIRKDFGQNVEQNATHGSDAPETAANEVAFFFRGLELLA